MDGTKQYEGNGCMQFIALAFHPDAGLYLWSGIEETAERAYESLCQDISEGDTEKFRICVFDLKDAIERRVEDFSAAGATYKPEEGTPVLTEREKAELIIDEWSKSDDPLLCQRAANIRAGISAIDAFNKGHYGESTPPKPTGYLNGKIEAIEKQLEACELYEKKVENLEASLILNLTQYLEVIEKIEERLGALETFMLLNAKAINPPAPKRPGGVIVDEMLDARCRQANQELLDHFTTCIKAPSMRTHAKVTLSLSKSGTWSARFTVKETLYYETGGYISLDALIANAKRQLDGCDFNLTDEVKP